MSARNFAHAKQTNPLWKDQLDARVVDDDMITNTPTITTVTVVEVLPLISTSIPSYSMIIPSDSMASTPLKSTTAVAITSTLLSQVPTSFVSLASSTPPSSFTASLTTSSGTPLPQDSKTFSSSLHPGAIAGLVIACIFIFFIGIFFAIRTWFKNRRTSKLRKTWSRSSVVGIPYDTDALESLYEPKIALGHGYSRLSVQIPSPHVSVPPISYNNDTVFQSPVSSSLSAFTSHVYLPGLPFLSPYSTTIVCTFIPSLPDELTIFVGETLRVLAEYEDGWSLCMDCRGVQGMVPNECLDRNSASMGFLLPESYRIARSSTRVTSLAQVVKSGH